MNMSKRYTVDGVIQAANEGVEKISLWGLGKRESARMIEFWQVLKGNRSVKELDISDNKLGARAMKSLSEALKENASLQSLAVRQNKFGPEGMKYLGEALKENTSIQSLDVSCTNLGPKGMKYLGEILKDNTSIQSLDVSDNDLGPKGMKFLAEVLKENSNIQSLKVSYNDPGPEGMRYLGEALKENTSVQILDFVNNGLDPEGMKYLSEALKENTGIQSLDVSYNEFGPENMKYLGEALKKNTSIQSLDVSQNGLGPQGMKYLREALKENTSIQSLACDRYSDGDIASYLARNRKIAEEVDETVEATNDTAENKEQSLFVEVSKIVANLAKARKSEIPDLAVPESAKIKEFANHGRDQNLCVQEWGQMKSKLDKLLKRFDDIQTCLRDSSDKELIIDRKSIREEIVSACSQLLRYESNQNRKNVFHWLTANVVNESEQSDTDDPNLFQKADELCVSVETSVLAWQTRFDSSHLRKATDTILEHMFTFKQLVQDPDLEETKVDMLEKILKVCRAELDSYNLSDVAKAFPQDLIDEAEEAIRVFQHYVLREFGRMHLHFEQVRETLDFFSQNLDPPLLDKVDEISHVLRCLNKEERKLQRDVLNATCDLDEYPGNTAMQQALNIASQNLEGFKAKATKEKRKRAWELMREQVRLLRIVDQYFPELLKDQGWLKQLHLDSASSLDSDMLSLMKSGKLLQGATINDFDERCSLGVVRDNRQVRLVEDEGKAKVLKIFNLQYNEALMKRFYRQCSLLDSLPSVHFCHIEGFFVDGDKGCLLMSYYPNGDLGTWLSNPMHASETEVKKRILTDVLTGLAVLHDRNLVHCDIKPQNIFLTRSNCGIIGDFDGMRFGDMTMTRVQVTDKYMCPEFLSAKEPHPTMDMYAVGVMIEEMFPEGGAEEFTGASSIEWVTRRL